MSGFNLGNALGGLGAGLAEVGSEQVKSAIEAQREARLNAYAQQLEDKRLANQRNLQESSQKFHAGESEKERASRKELNDSDNASSEKRTQALIGNQRGMQQDEIAFKSSEGEKERQFKKPLMDSQVGENSAQTGLINANRAIVENKQSIISQIESLDPKDPDYQSKLIQLERELQLANGGRSNAPGSAKHGYVTIPVYDPSGEYENPIGQRSFNKDTNEYGPVQYFPGFDPNKEKQGQKSKEKPTKKQFDPEYLLKKGGGLY